LKELSVIEDSPYIYDQVISFGGGGDRGSWKDSLPDCDFPNRRNTTDFWKVGKNKKNTCLALCSGPNAGWVGKPKEVWEDIPWHCFVIAVIKDPSGGKHLVFWDCDPEDGVNEKWRIDKALTCLKDPIYRHAPNKSTLTV
jgi:hypothetical protein